MKQIYIGILLLTLWMILSTASSETCDCQKKFSKRVVGELAKDTDFTSTVYIYGRYCTGTLIDTDLVLTAASCFDQSGTGLNFYIIYGLKDLNSITKWTRPLEVMIHESYDKGTLKNNIALVRTERSLTLDSALSVSCLPKGIDQAKLESMKVSVAGWGHSSVFTWESPTLTTSKKLHKAEDITVIDNDKCKFYISPSKDRDNMFCGYGPKGSPCYFDQGGTVTGVYNGVSYLVGMVIEKKNSCGLIAPNFYLNVAKYLNWIEFMAGKAICYP